MSNRESSTDFRTDPDNANPLIRRCAEIFAHESGPYQTAKQLSIQNHSILREHNTDTLLSFRRALTDVGDFFDSLEQSERNHAIQTLRNVERHLRETACNCAKVAPDHYLEEIERNRVRWFWAYRLLMLDAPTKKEFRSRMDAIEDQLDRAKRRELTKWELKIDDFEEAHEYACSLNADLPSPEKVRSRLFFVSTTIVGLAISSLSFLFATGTLTRSDLPF